MKTYIVDRILDHTVYLETEEKEILPVERNELPRQITEGTVLRYEKNGWRIDADVQAKRRNTAKSKLDALLRRKDHT